MDIVEIRLLEMVATGGWCRSSLWGLIIERGAHNLLKAKMDCV